MFQAWHIREIYCSFSIPNSIHNFSSHLSVELACARLAAGAKKETRYSRDRSRSWISLHLSSKAAFNQAELLELVPASLDSHASVPLAEPQEDTAGESEWRFDNDCDPKRAPKSGPLAKYGQHNVLVVSLQQPKSCYAARTALLPPLSQRGFLLARSPNPLLLVGSKDAYDAWDQEGQAQTLRQKHSSELEGIAPSFPVFRTHSSLVFASASHPKARHGLSLPPSSTRDMCAPRAQRWGCRKGFWGVGGRRRCCLFHPDNERPEVLNFLNAWSGVWILNHTDSLQG